MTDRLAVWLGDERVGDLVRDRRAFQYRQYPGASRLSVADQANEDVWTTTFTRAWFDGLLPEEERRSAAEVEHGVERGDSFGLLAAIGWECAGAVSVMPEGRTPASGSYLQLTDADVWSRLDALPRLVAEVDREVRLSLGGAQDKLLLARVDESWLLPLQGALSTHILKPEPARYPGLAAAEAWALQAAAGVTRTASAQLVTPPGHRPTVIVERYDRVVRPGSVVRIHQEDLCQVLGLPPTAKYARSTKRGEASLRRLADLLVARGVDAPAELIRLLEQTVVNVALANSDAHAKNISVVRASPRTLSLAPLYDVAPTLFFLPTQRQAALPVGGKWRIDEITRAHLISEARSWGIPDIVARATIDDTVERLQAGMANADAAVPDLPDGLRAVIRTQFERLAVSAA